MNNNKKSNNTKSVIIAVLAVVMIAAVAAGGTYAWWSWSSNSANAAENTEINFSISTPTFKITGTNITGKTLAPTPVCYTATSTAEGYGYTLTGKATAVATNNTTTAMKTTFVLSAKLTPVSGRTLSTDAKKHLHWAIKEVGSSDGYAVGNCNGSTNSATFATGTFENVGTTATDISTTITYDVPANTTNHTKYYQLYVWLDSTYSYTNTGSGVVSDPMQDATVLLTFSTTSKLEQKTS